MPGPMTLSNNLAHLNLGASLYVPASRDDLVEVAQGAKLGHARSIIFCTEDSVSEADVPLALGNLQAMLAQAKAQPGRLLFIRPRNEEVLRSLLKMPGISEVDGFVLPKVTEASLVGYLAAVKDHEFAEGLRPRSATGATEEPKKFWLMPTLETAEVFDEAEMARLRKALERPGVKSRVLALRIGGNDLLNVLGVRRSRQRTIYESPIGPTIAKLITLFRPHGFALTAPVCELLYDAETLQRELALDVEHGLVGKTAVHPDQVAVIEQAYRPHEQDVQMAEAILAPGAPAVFRMHGTMCEVATHRHWAQQVLSRRDLFGVFGEQLRPTVKSEAC